MTKNKGQIRKIRKNAIRIKDKLQHNDFVKIMYNDPLTQKERLGYSNNDRYFVCCSKDYNNAMEGI